MPIRLEIGARDIKSGEIRCCKRNDNQKMQIKKETVATDVPSLLEQIHKEMFDKALQSRNDCTKFITNWEDFMSALNNRFICIAPWCNEKACEDAVGDRSKEESLKAMEEANEDEVLLTGAAKTLCIPFEQTPLDEGAKCFACGKDATTKALWGRSY